MDRATFILSMVPIVLFEAHASTALVVVAVAVWAVSFTLGLPASVRGIVVSWQSGTRTKWRVRILRAHVAELRELTAELDAGETDDRVP